VAARHGDVVEADLTVLVPTEGGTGASSARATPAWGPLRTTSVALVLGRSAMCTTMSSSAVGDSCRGSTLMSVTVWSSMLSSTDPHDEQKPEVGGLQCPHLLQNTYAIGDNPNRR
jgi:hypothetical protein